MSVGSLKKRVYREGDVVRVVNPRFIERVGYPLTWPMLLDEVDADVRLPAIMESLGVRGYRAERDFKVGLCKALVRSRGFGGKERSIHYFQQSLEPVTEDSLSLNRFHYYQGREVHVYGKRVVKTGTYYPPSTYRSYEGEYDSEPGGLDNAKTHVLLETEAGLIEDCDVEFVRSEEKQ